MTREAHKVETNWREIDASALEERVDALNHWLDHTEDIIEMLSHDDEVRTKSLTLAGLIRSRRNDLASEAARLRTASINTSN